MLLICDERKRLKKSSWLSWQTYAWSTYTFEKRKAVPVLPLKSYYHRKFVNHTTFRTKWVYFSPLAYLRDEVKVVREMCLALLACEDKLALTFLLLSGGRCYPLLSRCATWCRPTLLKISGASPTLSIGIVARNLFDILYEDSSHYDLTFLMSLNSFFWLLIIW